MTEDKTMIMGISMPKVLRDTIDKERGDIPRSRYITKILKQQIMRQPERVNENHPKEHRYNISS
ncbi:MAG TPA: hypothetical protein VFI73_05735 [Candidatus Nitrosopolaris sp.]|nr:hypothetical protein [Candidatus Nitrosopolaris sp.]